MQYDLGRANGVRLTFTDAAGDLFLAVAEDSPDAYRDGPIAAAILGRIAADGAARFTHLRDPEGRPFVEKAEGLAIADSSTAWIVLDRDDPTTPAELCRVETVGF